MKSILAIFLFALLLGCTHRNDQKQIEKWKTEIVAVEKAFNDMAREVGIQKAFEYYAAEDGVIKRNNKLIKGKKEISNWYKKDVRSNESLTWKPTFIDISRCGDLAYTYGDFILTYPDSLGKMKSNTGVFHTVWKRQADGNWRFVWD